MELKEIKRNIIKIIKEAEEKMKTNEYYYGSITIKSGDCEILIEDLKEMYHDEGFSCEILTNCLGTTLVVNETTAPTMIEAVVRTISRICGEEVSSLYELEKRIEEQDKSNWAYWEACEQEELNMM